MTSDGSPYPRLKRAIAAGNLAIIEATAAELGWVALRDALGILLVIEAKDAERLAVRWAGRLALEVRDFVRPSWRACWSRWARCRTSMRSARCWRWPSAPASRVRRQHQRRRRRGRVSGGVGAFRSHRSRAHRHYGNPGWWV
jgi:hypothetical protein